MTHADNWGPCTRCSQRVPVSDPGAEMTPHGEVICGGCLIDADRDEIEDADADAILRQQIHDLALF
jgi:hypothetical protein